MKKDFINYTILLSVGTIVSRLFVFLYRMVLAKTLTLDDYGKLALIISIFSSIGILAHIDIATVMSKYAAEWKVKKKEQLCRLYTGGLIAVIPTSIITSIVFTGILHYYGFESIRLAFLFLLAFISFSIFRQSNGFIRGFEKIHRNAIYSSLIGFTRFFILLILFYVLGIKTVMAGLYAFILSNIIP
ncbi:MAG: hypothetical protein ABH851_02970, partial [Methanobacteriota archaeon]